MSKVIILVGTEGAGKTYTAKAITKPVHPKALVVFDTNKEWTKEYPYPFDRNMDNFLNKVDAMTNCVAVFEDATSFFSTNGREQKLVEIITERRHSHNSFIFLFHNFQDIPKYILRKGTDWYVFKTMDLESYMNNTFKNTIFLHVWKRVQQKAATNKFYSKSPPPPGTVPSFEYFRK